MLVGYESVRGDRASVDARILLAGSLDDRTRAWAKTLAKAHAVETVDVDPRAGIAYALPAFDAALCASGTASLECALAGVVPVVCYRVGWATEVGARALLKTPHVALPNVLLGRPAFPELLQRDAAASRIAEELARVLDERDTFLAACAEVERALGDRACPSREVARLLEPWLAAPASLPGHGHLASSTF
jgi:lipid-A-disaccharide synthase